jgi:hypothetical protein
MLPDGCGRGALAAAEQKVWQWTGRIENKYNPEQPRVPAGNSDGGQWTQIASGFGILLTEIPVPGGRRCVYNFGAFRVVVPGPINFQCPLLMPLAGTTHGYLLNDN